MESVSKVIFLSFSSDGSQLLVVLSMGRVHLFTKGAGLHHWTSSHTCDWDGEDILHINFFHGGIRVSLHLASFTYLATGKTGLLIVRKVISNLLMILF